MRNLAQPKILATTLALPPLDEQHEIVQRAKAALSAADRLGAVASLTGRALGRSAIFAATEDLQGDEVTTAGERPKANGQHYDEEVIART